MEPLRKFVDRLASNSSIFNFLRKILEINFIVQSRLVNKHFSDFAGKKVLDIGCGTGEFAKNFIHTDYHGIDITPQYIEYAKRSQPGNFSVMNATKMRFSDNEFDAALIMAILHHLDDETASNVLCEARRVLKPGGKILIMEDAKIASVFNFVTKPLQALDKGDYIRKTPEYIDLISPHFEISEHGEFRSGAITYAYFVVVNNLSSFSSLSS